jgi:hypothetical protein
MHAGIGLDRGIDLGMDVFGMERGLSVRIFSVTRFMSAKRADLSDAFMR